jgi:hypothetical protein
MTIRNLLKKRTNFVLRKCVCVRKDTLDFTAYTDIFHSNLELGLLSHKNQYQEIMWYGASITQQFLGDINITYLHHLRIVVL